MQVAGTFRTSFRAIGARAWPRVRMFSSAPSTPAYHQVLSTCSEPRLARVRIDRATVPYYQPELMNHLRTHLPDWGGFTTVFETHVYQTWNTVYGDWDWSEFGGVVEVEQPLLQRDRLIQIFAACPTGSYGYYAQYGLAPFKAVVGSFAAATIDEFFASQVHFLKQPMSAPMNDIMSSLETKYWDSQQDFTDWLAGKTFTKGMRELGVSVPASLLTVWEGKRKPALPPGEALEEEQLAEATAVLHEALPGLDASAFQSFAADLYQRLTQAEPRAKGKTDE